MKTLRGMRIIKNEFLMKIIQYLTILCFCVQSSGCYYTRLESKKAVNALQELRPVDSTAFNQLMERSKNPEELLLVDGIKLTIHYGDNLFYLIRSGKKEKYHGYSCIIIKSKEALIYENKYVKSKEGKTLILRFSSSDEYFAPIDETGDIIFKRPGNLIITVSIADKSVQIPIRVKLIPLHQSMNHEEVISSLGLPDVRHEGFVPWLDSVWIDGILYYPSSIYDVYGESFDHWLYKKFPKAILRFDVLNELYGVVMASWISIARYGHK